MRNPITVIISFGLAAAAMPVTFWFTHPMIRRIATSGPGLPDLSVPRLITMFGLAVAVGGYLFGMVSAMVCIRRLPRVDRPSACFFTALALACVPLIVVGSGGASGAPGDGGPDILPLVVIAAGLLLSLPFLFWALASTVPERESE